MNGNDVAQVYVTAQGAIQRARNGEGPTFIECKTMRVHGHSEHDSAKYVPRELLEEWKEKDPILKAERVLKELKYADEGALHLVKERVDKEIQKAVDFAEKSPMPEGSEVLEGVYAENPVEVQA